MNNVIETDSNGLMTGKNPLVILIITGHQVYTGQSTYVCKAALVALMRFLSVIFSSINKALVS